MTSKLGYNRLAGNTRALTFLNPSALIRIILNSTHSPFSPILSRFKLPYSIVAISSQSSIDRPCMALILPCTWH